MALLFIRQTGNVVPHESNFRFMRCALPLLKTCSTSLCGENHRIHDFETVYTTNYRPLCGVTVPSKCRFKFIQSKKKALT